jgi:hypothetical protein
VTTPTVDPSAGLVEHEPEQLSRYYRDTFGWPTTVDRLTGEVHLRLGDVMDAVFLRTEFAEAVDNLLVRYLLRAPIIVTPGEPGEWIFLTGPRTTMRLHVFEEMMRLHVGWKRRGDTIALPALDAADAGIRWLEPPTRRRELPPWSAVVNVARSVPNACGMW